MALGQLPGQLLYGLACTSPAAPATQIKNQEINKTSFADRGKLFRPSYSYE